MASYRRRQSTKKSSGFKIQNQKMVFKNFMDQIPNCLALSTFPNLKQDVISQTSETVYNYCYSFRQDSPFTKGLNYYCRDIGFAISQNVVTYRQCLPGVSKAYLMGQFNDFDKNSHEMTKLQNQPNWFQAQLNASKISDGSRLILRIIDHQGTQYNMIPPSCLVTSGNYGIFLKYRKSPLAQNPIRPSQLLAFMIDVEDIKFQNLLKYLNQRKPVLEKFTTIVFKNVFTNKGVLHRYTIDQKYQEIFEESIQFINEQLKCKVSLEWNCNAIKQYYSGNPVQQGYSCKIDSDKYQFALHQPDTFAFTLSTFSFFKNYFNIDGFYLNGIDWIASSNDGVIFLKCLSVLQYRLSEHGITIASMKTPIPAVCHKLLEGGMGLTYAINTDEQLNLFLNHQELLKIIQNTSPYSNCLSIKLAEGHLQSKMNIFLTYLASQKGVFCQGKVWQYMDIMKRILKLRSQGQFFVESFKPLEVNETRIFAQRGRSLIFFNFSDEETTFEVEGIQDAEFIFNSQNEEPIREKNCLKLKGKSCVLFEKAE